MHRLAWLLLVGCASAPPASPASAPSSAPHDPCAGSVSLVTWQDLPRDDERSHGLSALSWDDAARTLYAVGDKTPAIHALLPDATFTRFSFGASMPVSLEERWDVEGLAIAGERFYLGNEAGPWVHVVGRDGAAAGQIALPDSFRRSRYNHGLESLVATPDGRVLVVANEHAFTDDGEEADATRGTVVRLTRIDLATGAATQQRYTTDPVFADDPKGRIGVVDVMAPTARTLYVTERAYVPGHGNSVRIYCVDGERDKRLLVDLASLTGAGLPASLGPQRNPILENFEGFTLGPTRPDGRRLIFAVSDDNGSPLQFPRLLVLALESRR